MIDHQLLPVQTDLPFPLFTSFPFPHSPPNDAQHKNPGDYFFFKSGPLFVKTKGPNGAHHICTAQSPLPQHKPFEIFTMLHFF